MVANSKRNEKKEGKFHKKKKAKGKLKVKGRITGAGAKIKEKWVCDQKIDP